MQNNHKLLLILFCATVGFLSAIKMFDYTVAQRVGFKRAIDQTYLINKHLFLLRKNEKDFINRLGWEDRNKFQSNARLLTDDIDQLNFILKRSPASFQQTQKSLEEYTGIFEEVCQSYKQIGLDYEQGLRGELKQRFIRLEVFLLRLGQKDPVLGPWLEKAYVSVLKMSLQEKNFLMRCCPKYINRFDEEAQDFLNQVQASPLPSEYKELLAGLLKDYVETFHEIHDLLLMLDSSTDSKVLLLSAKAAELEQHINKLVDLFTDEFVQTEQQLQGGSLIFMAAFSGGLFLVALLPFGVLLSGNGLGVKGYRRSGYVTEEAACSI